MPSYSTFQDTQSAFHGSHYSFTMQSDTGGGKMYSHCCPGANLRQRPLQPLLAQDLASLGENLLKGHTRSR